MTLVEFVEQDGADAVEHRVVLQHAGQDAFGDHFDARLRRHFRFETDAVADGGADRFAERLGHEAGGRARGDAARFQHQDLAVEPRRFKQGQRHLGGLAGAGWCFQHEPRMCRQRGDDVGQQRRNREERGGHPRIVAG